MCSSTPSLNLVASLHIPHIDAPVSDRIDVHLNEVFWTRFLPQVGSEQRGALRDRALEWLRSVPIGATGEGWEEALDRLLPSDADWGSRTYRAAFAQPNQGTPEAIESPPWLIEQKEQKVTDLRVTEGVPHEKSPSVELTLAKRKSALAGLLSGELDF